MVFRPIVALAALVVATPLYAQQARPDMSKPIPPAEYPSYVRTSAPSDATIQRIWDEGMNRSQAMSLAQVLLDPLGQRLTGSPESDAAQEWIVQTYRSWGVDARKEQYGTWLGWSRGLSHVDLISPRKRTLDAAPLAWTPGTGAGPVIGEVVTYPVDVTSPEQFDAWLPNVKGKIFLMDAPRLSCRSEAQWAEFGMPEEIERVEEEQRSIQTAWNQTNVAMSGGRNVWLKLKDAGALAVLSSRFSGYPAISKVFGSPNQTIPAFSVGCEDYGLLFRMARNGQAPLVSAYTDSELLGERPVFNVVAEIRGSEKPGEYVMLSAHFDSWSGASGATDNGTGTITMLEALRILKTVYPTPKRTILVGHWNGEEQGLNGSRAFSADHPEIVSGLQALFNQDNGTGRVVSMTAGPFPGAAARLEQYLGEIPNEITRWIRYRPTSSQSTGGTDHASFVCHKAPAFSLGGLSWDYGSTTWHTDRDTYDKVVASDLKNNATLVAMLAYLASEDPERMPRDVMDPLPPGRGGRVASWVDCREAQRSLPEAVR